MFVQRQLFYIQLKTIENECVVEFTQHKENMSVLQTKFKREYTTFVNKKQFFFMCFRMSRENKMSRYIPYSYKLFKWNINVKPSTKRLCFSCTKLFPSFCFFFVRMYSVRVETFCYDASDIYVDSSDRSKAFKYLHQKEIFLARMLAMCSVIRPLLNKLTLALWSLIWVNVVLKIYQEK